MMATHNDMREEIDRQHDDRRGQRDETLVAELN
jgi:hypothetical protein